MDARTEFQEKLKYYSALEKKVRRQLLKDENEEAIKTLIQIIQGYKSIGVIEKAKLLEEELANFASASNLNLQQFYESAGTVEEPEKPSARSDDSGQILGFIESLEKKVKRRILQGKTQEAITDLKYIISELRNLRNFEKAELLEATLNQFIAELAASSSGPSVPFVTTPQTQFAPQVYSLPRPASPPVPAPPAFARAPPAVNPNSEFAPNIADLLPGARPRAQPPMPPQVPMAPPAHPPIATPASPPSVAITPPLQPSTLPVPPNATPSATLKDQPYSDEELLLKKLFEIKDMLGKK
ncbi:MAG: hypothetical protein LUQ65_14260 [Candidatus Helarchaeota archaeon]|nr:hypothetical protein [Candidatus Helarchaeota archaeon]